MDGVYFAVGELERVETVGRHEEVEHARRNERSVAPRRVQPTADRRLDKINKKVNLASIDFSS